MPCNFHLRDLAEHVKAGIREAGGTPMEFNTVAISDGITMGTEGMKASLVSREVIADSIELVGRGHMFDAVVALAACDKTIPGCAMGLIRLDVPGFVLYGGSIAPGRFEGRDVTIQDVFEAVGAHARGLMTDEQFRDLEDHACPGAGACGGQFTANTMALALEFLGLSPVGTASPPALDPRKKRVAHEAGRLVMDQLTRGLKPRDILTRLAFENAIAGVAATGGSTNAVLHLLAIAREAGVPLTIDDFDTVSERTPTLADLKPGGRYVAADLDRAGGTRLVAQRLLSAGKLDGGQLTPSGKSLADEAAVAVEEPGQDVVRPVGRPLKPTGGLVILKGNLAPEGCVVKVAGNERRLPSRAGPRLRPRGGRDGGRHRQPDPRGRRGRDPLRGAEGRAGHARDARRDRRDRRPGARRVGGAADRRPLQRRHPRPDGRPRRPRGRPWRPDRRRARGRHDRPRPAQPEAGRRAVRRRDRTTDSPRWTPPEPHYTHGVFAKYAALVSSASEGAITRPTSG